MSSSPRPSPTVAQPRSDVSARALDVYRDAIVVDMHNDLPSRILDEEYDADHRHTPAEGHTDLPRLVESGITAEWMIAWVDAPYAAAVPDQSYARAERVIELIHAFVARHPQALLSATTAADVRRAKREGKVAILIGVEGGHAIEGSLERLRELYRRGARYLTLTWNNGNDWAGSSIGVNGTRTGGLTRFGEDVIRELNRLGMLVDISHASDATVADVVAVSSAPVIASHSSARALSDHPRNLPDDLIRAIAATGGVVNANFYPRFIDTRLRADMDALEHRVKDAAEYARAAVETPADRAAASARWRAAVAQLPPSPLSVLIDHLDHIANVAGVDHVGIGSDFDGVSALPAGLEDITALPRIAEALLERDYSDADISKVLGGNMMRVMEQVLDRPSASDLD